MEERNKIPLKRISRWGQFVGIITIIIGSISAIVGLFDFIIGAIPGVISIILGYLIFRTGRAAKYIATSEDVTMTYLNELLDKYGKMLLISGIMAILLLALLLFALVLLFIALIAGM
ncbi:hypothetical protein EPH95_06720 [Salicibibacter halophilus]|uniref:DUF5362 domain-containing protein n=1 Tax=Salicibibacter halophilus TaxID=2502791 RepID=A0A514LGD2_9BACI|nr:DUF5362 family protein [Salicibibacter halophilus]QDI90908.1 hypothetical protein EPH95_06720 [Salicibibacter halophilus]